MADTDPVFTAARIAEIAGQDRKTIREQLDVVQARPVRVKGQLAQAWPVSALPTTLRAQLEALSREHGYQDVTRFLENGRSRWQPKVSIGKIAPHHVGTAQKRCAVLAPIVQSHRSSPVSLLAGLAQTAWKKAFGYAPTDRTMRRWIERAIERDRGFEDLNRWAIWLDDDISTVPPTQPAASAEAFQMPALEQAINAVAKPVEPTPSEREYLWLSAMADADTLAKQGAKEEIVREIILTVLNRSGLPLAKNIESLKVSYRRKRTRWIASGGIPSSIQDKRPDQNRDRKWTLPNDDRLILARYLINCSDLASAWRLAVKNKVFTPETTARFTDDPADKSYVPAAIRDAMADVVEAKAKHQVGPRTAKLSGGYIERDHSGYAPGDWWQGDDLTPPVYFWDDLGNGPFLTRGQIVMMIDCRTMCVLGWVLGSAKSYNSRQIRHLITLCHDQHGLPRNGFYFERGIWKNSRVLKGKIEQTIVDFQETETGLREFGLHFQHATTPRAKVIERVFGLLQNRMESVRGYCGRNEKVDCPEEVRKWILNVNSERHHPSEYFLHKDDWTAEIGRIVAEYNSEKHGPRAKLIPGQSPNEAYAARSTNDVIRLRLECRYLLANHRLTLKVTRNGIRLPSGGLGGGLYRGETTGTLIGQQVLVWVNPDDLTTITVTDLDRSNPRLVDRADALPAFSESPSEISAAVAQLAAHNRHGANIYRVVSAGEKPGAFRQVVSDRKTVEVGAEMIRQAADHKDQARFVADGRRFIEREAIKHGLPIRAGDTPNKIARQIEALQMRNEALLEIKREGAGASSEDIS